MGIVVNKPLPYKSIPSVESEDFTSINMTSHPTNNGMPMVPIYKQTKHFRRVLTRTSARGKPPTGNAKQVSATAQRTPV